MQAERSSMASTHENQELMVPSPSPTQSSPTHSLLQLGTVATNAPSGEPSSPGPLASGTLPRDGASPTGQVNAITVLTLLDKLVNMLDTVQENQHKMEMRQVEIEGGGERHPERHDQAIQESHFHLQHGQQTHGEESQGQRPHEGGQGQDG